MCFSGLTAFQKNGLCFGHLCISSTSKLARIKLFKSSTELIHSQNYLTTQAPQLKPQHVQDLLASSVLQMLNISQKKRRHSSHQPRPPSIPPSPAALGLGGKDVSISSLHVQKMLPAHWIKVPKWQLSTLVLTDLLRH